MCEPWTYFSFIERYWEKSQDGFNSPLGSVMRNRFRTYFFNISQGELSNLYKNCHISHGIAAKINIILGFTVDPDDKE